MILDFGRIDMQYIDMQYAWTFIEAYFELESFISFSSMPPTLKIIEKFLNVFFYCNCSLTFFHLDFPDWLS